MSLCYDFSKWTMITLASFAISLTIGLIGLAYGQTVDNQSKIIAEIEKLCEERQALKNGSAYDIPGLRAPDMEIPDFEIDMSDCEGYLK